MQAKPHAFCVVVPFYGVLGFANLFFQHTGTQTGRRRRRRESDIRLVLQICEYAVKRDAGYHLLFLGLAVLAAIILVASPSALIVTPYVIAAAILYFAKTYNERFRLSRAFAKDAFDEAQARATFAADLDSEIADALPSEDQNLIVYSGFTPFVGAGLDLGGWSFTVSTEKCRDDLGPTAKIIPFSIPELYDTIRAGLATLNLSGLDLKDMYFVHGSDIRDDREILPDEFGRPLQVLSTDRASLYRYDSDSRVRQYLWIRIKDWGGDLVVSYFLRCAKRGSTLFVEIKRFLLTPLASRYREVDAIASPDWRTVLGLMFVSLIIGPFYAINSAIVMLMKLTKSLGHILGGEERSRRHLIAQSPLYNYGVDLATRERLSSKEFVHYFQKIDGDFYNKVVESKVLDTVVSFLTEHNVDTSDLKDRRTTILNSGVIVQGGDIRAESLAVGVGAQAVKHTEKQTKSFKKGAGE